MYDVEMLEYVVILVVFGVELYVTPNRIIVELLTS
jgi:hypothetical protein